MGLLMSYKKGVLQVENIKELQNHKWEIIKYINKEGKEIAARDLYMNGNYIATIPETGYISTHIRNVAEYHNEILELHNL